MFQIKFIHLHFVLYDRIFMRTPTLTAYKKAHISINHFHFFILFCFSFSIKYVMQFLPRQANKRKKKNGKNSIK